MNNITHIIMFKNAVETLGYFSLQLKEAFEGSGLSVLMLDFDDLSHARKKIISFHSPGHTAIVTFNFIGLSGEEAFEAAEDIPVWDVLDMPCLNILVDHPLYYFKSLLEAPSNMQLFCVDRTHVSFVKRYYPQIKNVYFLPLAGNIDETPESFVPYREKEHDIIFMANYVDPKTINKKIDALEEDYRIFYNSVTDRLLSDTELTIDRAFEDAIFAEFPNASIIETLSAMHGMLFIDLLIRSHFRELIISQIAKSSLKVFIVGKDWDKIRCSRPENITCTGQLSSSQCLSHLKKSRLSLNILPWFKDGAHDRLFTSMLHKIPCISDSSPYIREILTENEDFACFSLKEIDKIPQMISQLLSSPEKLDEIAEKAFKKAFVHHTWQNRASILLDAIGKL